MDHLKYALAQMSPEKRKFITLTEPNHVSFQIQDGPIKEAGVNGIQANDMHKFVMHLYMSLQNAYPCTENANTITCLQQGLEWQLMRDKDRQMRGVEGTSAP